MDEDEDGLIVVENRRGAFLAFGMGSPGIYIVIGFARRRRWPRRRWQAELWNMGERVGRGEPNGWLPLPVGDYPTLDDALDVLEAAWLVRAENAPGEWQ